MKIKVAESNSVATHNQLIGKKMSRKWLLINRETGESHVQPTLIARSN